MEFEICRQAPDEWQVQSIADVCQRITSGGTPSRKTSAYFEEGSWPWVKTQELNDCWIDDTEEHITDEAIKESSAKVLPPNTVLLAMYGATVGQLGITRRPMTCNQASCALIADESKSHFRYLYYLLLSQRSQIKSLSTGAAQQNLSAAQIKQFRLPFPSVGEQRAIAHILGTLDDKIELNRRMNETLEAMARAIFNSWFVDFDPVRAKASGEPPESICRRLGLTPDVLALFPDSFQDSEIGEIPAGWTVRCLDSIADFLNGLALQKYPATGDEWLPVIKIAQLRAGHTLSADRANTEIPPAYVVENGDVLFSWSGSLEVEIWCGGQGALNQHLFKVTSADYPKWFYFLWTRHHLQEFRDIAANKATTMGHIQRKHLTDAKVLCPDEKLMSSMEPIIGPLISKLVSCRLEENELTAMRDTLLPRLLCGDLSIPELEAVA